MHLAATSTESRRARRFLLAPVDCASQRSPLWILPSHCPLDGLEGEVGEEKNSGDTVVDEGFNKTVDKGAANAERINQAPQGKGRWL